MSGLGTALKPAVEPIVLARRPLSGTVAANVLEHGTGALNIDGTRVQAEDGANFRRPATATGEHEGWTRPWQNTADGVARWQATKDAAAEKAESLGRWPANVVLSHGPDCRPPRPSVEDIAHDRALAELQGVDYVPWPGETDPDTPAGCQPGCPVAELDAQSGTTTSKRSNRGDGIGDGYHGSTAAWDTVRGFSDYGGASRFFPVFRYQAKAPARERPTYVREGVDGSVAGAPSRSGRRCNVCGNQTVPAGGKPWPACGHDDWSRFETENRTAGKVAHPTVKPLALMQWLVRLVTPPGGTVLDPFAGSGTTVEAAMLEGFDVIAVEREADYLPLIQQRIDRAHTHFTTTANAAEATPSLFDLDGDAA